MQPRVLVDFYATRARSHCWIMFSFVSILYFIHYVIHHLYIILIIYILRACSIFGALSLMFAGGNFLEHDWISTQPFPFQKPYKGRCFPRRSPHFHLLCTVASGIYAGSCGFQPGVVGLQSCRAAKHSKDFQLGYSRDNFQIKLLKTRRYRFFVLFAARTLQEPTDERLHGADGDACGCEM